MQIPLEEHVLLSLQSTCSEFGISLSDAIEEKIQELKVRHFLKCLPNDRIKESDISKFVFEVLGRTPSVELIDSVTRKSRTQRISTEERMSIERSQSFRCALCGELLVQGAESQVDHKIPVALGGKSELANYQLLCRRCNQGKSDISEWIMGAPFLAAGHHLPSTLRYCVLARDGGNCRVAGCENNASTTQLTVSPKIPVSRGGRWIFDNLVTFCSECDSKRQSEELCRNRMQMKMNQRLIRRIS